MLLLKITKEFELVVISVVPLQKTPVAMREIIFRKALNSADLLLELCLKCIFQVKVGLKWNIIESKEDRAM